MKLLATPGRLGTAALITGAINGLYFFSLAVALWLYSGPVTPPESLASGLFAALAGFAFLQTVAGVALVGRQRWGARLVSGVALGTVIVGMLGSGLAIAGLFPNVGGTISFLFYWAAAFGIAWAVVVQRCLQSESMKAAFAKERDDQSD